MIEKVLQFVRKQHMIEDGDRVLAGVSGGADSVCMLLVLCQLKKEIEFELRVFHVEHGIRGEESRKDCAFVEALCRQKQIPCKSVSIDVPAKAKEMGMTMEEAARTLRYEAMGREAEDWGNAKIAVAHNRNDDAETVLFHLVRGTGLRGLGGIAPVRANIIRPLLETDRKEILEFLEKEGQDYCTDSTNSNLDYSRNRIRNEVLPQLTLINSQTTAHIQQASDMIRMAAAYIEEQAAAATKECLVIEEDCVRIKEKELMSRQELIRKEILQKALTELSGSRKDIEKKHLEQIEELFCRQAGKCSSLPYGIEACRTYEGVRLSREKRPKILTEIQFSQKELQQLEEGVLQKGEFTLRLLKNHDNFIKISPKTYTKWFDYDKIRGDLSARSRREGDYFVCNQQGNEQKLNRFFINEKIEAEKRDSIWLLAEGTHILWIVGYRISNYYKVQKETKRILEVQFNGGREND